MEGGVVPDEGQCGHAHTNTNHAFLLFHKAWVDHIQLPHVYTSSNGLHL